jgi:hypothetical protein
MAMIPRKAPDANAAAAAAPTATAPAPAAAPAQAAAPAAAPADSTAVATASPTAGAVSTRVAVKPRNAIEEGFKNKMVLEWNTLHRIQANQGNFLDKEASGQSFGSVIVAQLMSYQPSWQISPGTDDAADAELVRYSDDGITTNKGEDCKEYLAALIESNRDKAKMSARYQMALVIEETPMDPTGAMVNKIVQIDLSATSKNAFDQFMLENGYKESRGMITKEVAESGRLKMTAKVKNNTVKGRTLSWTVVQFENA